MGPSPSDLAREEWHHLEDVLPPDWWEARPATEKRQFSVELRVATIRDLQSALKGPSPSSSVHFISERATIQPSSSANVCCQPSVLLSVLLSKKPRLAGAVLRRDSDMMVAQDCDKSRRTTTVLKQAARCREPVSPSCCVMLGRGGEPQQLRAEQRSTAVPHSASGYQLCCAGFHCAPSGTEPERIGSRKALARSYPTSRSSSRPTSPAIFL